MQCLRKAQILGEPDAKARSLNRSIYWLLTPSASHSCNSVPFSATMPSIFPPDYSFSLWFVLLVVPYIWASYLYLLHNFSLVKALILCFWYLHFFNFPLLWASFLWYFFIQTLEKELLIITAHLHTRSCHRWPAKAWVKSHCASKSHFFPRALTTMGVGIWAVFLGKR